MIPLTFHASICRFCHPTQWAENYRVRIADIFWLTRIADKLASKHDVATGEVEDVIFGSARFRYVRKGERRGEDVYMALGQTFEGRYLTVLFIHKLNGVALILSARDMTSKERRFYDRK